MKNYFQEKILLISVLSAQENFVIFWKTWLAESLTIKVLELQPAFLFKKGLLSEIISKVKNSEVFFKMTLYFRHFTNFREMIRGDGRFPENFFKLFRADSLTLSSDCFRSTKFHPETGARMCFLKQLFWNVLDNKQENFLS